jgi:UDP-N-acetylmuramate dehydrogenase
VSTFGIGGPARFFCEAHSIEEMIELLKECDQENLPFFILGKGSNCLFDDKGFNGVVILNKISFFKQEGELIEVGAGYSFSLLGAQTARKGWSGLEFASGIPASVGGAVYMNAGANGGETKDCLVEVSFVNAKGHLGVFSKNEIEFKYRFSSFQNIKGAIVAAKFKLTPHSEARKKQRTIIDYRTNTQPYSEKSAGCMFQNPIPLSAGALIDQCGLKGTSIGGAQVSTLHGNFIINAGNATAHDVMELVKLIKKTVKEKKNIDLETEVRFIPYEHVSS